MLEGILLLALDLGSPGELSTVAIFSGRSRGYCSLYFVAGLVLWIFLHTVHRDCPTISLQYQRNTNKFLNELVLQPSLVLGPYASGILHDCLYTVNVKSDLNLLQLDRVYHLFAVIRSSPIIHESYKKYHRACKHFV